MREKKPEAVDQAGSSGGKVGAWLKAELGLGLSDWGNFYQHAEEAFQYIRTSKFKVFGSL